MRINGLKWLVFLCFTVYSLIIFIWGDTGIKAMSAQTTAQYQLQKNIVELVGINTELNKQLESYKSDPETIKIQARELGYLQEKEQILFIDGMPKEQNTKKPGNIIVPILSYHSIEPFLRIIFLIILLPALLLSGIKFFRISFFS